MLYISYRDPDNRSRRQRDLDRAIRIEVASHFKALGRTPTSQEEIRHYQRVRKKLAQYYFDKHNK